LPDNENLTTFQDVFDSWARLLRTFGPRSEDVEDRPKRAADVGERQTPTLGDPQLVSLLSEAWLLLMTSGVRYWIGAAETWLKLLPFIDLSLGSVREDPTRPSEARAVLIDELRASFRSLADISYQESRRAQATFENLVRNLASDVQNQTNEHWRRWTVKP
jgi:hypothetical protein